ncbi:MAG: hypothetical protein KIS96_14690 [Bauldia sp.]|nr:hypothetical protein [Bauldia sp.]
MKLRALAVLLPLAVLLAGCFTSEEPLLAAADADFPFERIVYAAEDGSTSTLVRQGDGYVAPDDTSVTVLLQSFGEGLYFVQLAGVDETGEPQALYAVAIDADGEIHLYRMLAQPQDLAEGGVPRCEGEIEEVDFGCLTDPAQLVNVVRAAIAAGEPPDAVLTVVELE